MRFVAAIISSCLALGACAHPQRPVEAPPAELPPAQPATSETAEYAAASGESAAVSSSGPAEAPTPSSAPAAAGEKLSFKPLDGNAGADPAQHKLSPDDAQAAVLFRVIDKDKGPVRGVVIALSSNEGDKRYTYATSTEGLTELLLPVGKTYEAVFLSLARRDLAASVEVPNEPNLRLRLTLRYKRFDAAGSKPPKLVLSGVTFDTAKATLRPESFPKLEGVIEYMTHMKSARVELSGHTDNQGNAEKNKSLSLKRAEAVRDYLVKQGIELERLSAVGYGDERPVASNATEAGRQENRRIEARELP
jgi:outer membrane protein OmpA-like peptidoglycan-associated protein